MASRAGPKSAKTDLPLRGLFSSWMVFGVWLPVAVISAFHYGTSHEYHWVHDILRRAYYLPIVAAALRLGLIGGLVSAAVVTLAYLPHAFLVVHHFDPARGLEKALEIVLYFIVAGVAGYLADLERKRRVALQASLLEQGHLTEQLVRAGRLSALGEVVAGIAHEIKNPLHSLAGTAEIIDPLIPPAAEERRMWEIHREEIGRLGRVAERFLSFANPAPVDPIPVALEAVAQRIVALVEADARQKAIEVSCSIDGDAKVLGDLDQLAQIGLNIVVNAIKAMENKGGKVLLSVGNELHRDKTMAFLRIENNGPFLSETELLHLFEPFHSGRQGTGLGLAISARIAEQHGGYIEGINAKAGVAFTLFLPPAKP